MKAIRIVGCILAALQFILTGFLVYVLYQTSMVPFKMMVIGAVVLAIIPIIEVLMMKRRGSAIFGILLSMVMSAVICYGIYFVNSTNKAIEDVTGQKTQVEQVNVYVSKDDPVSSVNEAVDAGYIFGILKNDDSENVNKTIEGINNDLGVQITVTEFDSIYDMVVSFELKSINGFIINSGMLSVLDSSEEYTNYGDNLKVILEKEVEVELTTEAEREPIDEDRFTLYISGIDTYGTVTVKSRSDVNIIAVVNNKTHNILLVSTPRDYYVSLPVLGGAKDKLTHAGVYGIDASMGALQELYSVQMDYFVRMNFSGFKKIVDELGGIDVYSEQGFTTIGDISFSAGMNHLDGENALAFARERYAFESGDRQRGNNQMAVIKAIIKKMESPEMLSNYANIMDSLSGTFQTDMTKEDVGEVVQKTLDSRSGWNIVSYSVSGSDGEDICSSVGARAYVMYPYQSDVDYAKELINLVMNDGSITQEEIDAHEGE